LIVYGMRGRDGKMRREEERKRGREEEGEDLTK
jgi:hypothetical protein